MSEELLSLATRALREQVDGRSEFARETEARIVERSGQGARTFAFPARVGLAALFVGSTVWAGGGGILQFARDASERLLASSVGANDAAQRLPNGAQGPSYGAEEDRAGVRTHSAAPGPSAQSTSQSSGAGERSRGSDARLPMPGQASGAVGRGRVVAPSTNVRSAGADQLAKSTNARRPDAEDKETLTRAEAPVGSDTGASHEGASEAGDSDLVDSDSSGRDDSAARELDAYGRAHRLHFVLGDFRGALAGWDAYLAAYPRGSLALEARFNRALCLMEVGQAGRARRELEPFASGAYGAYRRAESQRLLERLD